MAHLVNNIHESFGVVEPQASEAKEQTWTELLPTLLAGLRSAETLPAALVLFRQMAEAADKNGRVEDGSLIGFGGRAIRRAGPSQ